ncbi:MAG: archaetidylserine decarboxylase [Rhodanobacteraceae bacterium]
MTPELALQYLLPHRLLSRLVYHATRWRFGPWKNFLIRQVMRRYEVNLSEAEQTDPFAYESFNAFFTRALKSSARAFNSPPGFMVSPADGCLSELGALQQESIMQAKDRSYSCAELLADPDRAGEYRDGSFVTIYLAPRDYHRVHMPLGGTLVETLHIPGRLFSVAPFTVAAVPRLFARNERLVCHFAGDAGPFAVVLVGAMLVSSIETTWNGLEIPPYASRPHHIDYRQRDVRLAQGAELGRFNMGSTVIVLMPRGSAKLDDRLAADQPVKVGEPLGRIESGS